FDLNAAGRRYSAPAAFDLGEILGDRTDRAILLGQFADDVIHWLKHVLVYADVPVAVGHDVVAGAGLRFGGRGQFVLFTLRGDVVDLDLAIVLGAPFVAKLGQGVVGAGHPVVPHAERQRARRVSAVDIGRGNSGGGAECGRFNKFAAGWACAGEQA